MPIDFDRYIERRGTNSLKYDFASERGRPADVLPLWVADMDFATAPPVVEALQKAVAHGVFGYAESKGEYFEAVAGWYAARFGWNLREEWLVKTPGVVFAICTAIKAFTAPGDTVLIEPPVYYPFSHSVAANGRRLVTNPLRYENGAYRIDFDDFEQKITEEKVRLFILCSPHNPVGRVFTKTELIRLGEICLRHGVLVVSDEIHSDFVYGGYRHSMFASLDPAFSDITVTCTSPSKTFNLAGLQVSNVLIENARLRRLFKKEMDKAGYSQVGGLGLAACTAAYRSGGPWLDELLVYLAGNFDYLRAFLLERLPGLRLVEPQGTYLAWIDCAGLGLAPDALDTFFLNRAKLWLDDGAIFGEEGKGFERINLACPRKTLETALLKIEEAVKTL